MRLNFNPLFHPVCFEQPRYISGHSAWEEHIPFAFALVSIVRPRILVELGTHYGDSYFAFCQAMQSLHIDGKSYAVDTWEGDSQTGSYGSEVYATVDAYHARYERFSRLIKDNFDNVAEHFADHTIDILHIDGLHTYGAVKHDVETWMPKISTRGMVLLHDINVLERDFGVSKLWDELKAAYPHVEFPFGHGLGVLLIGEEVASELRDLAESEEGEKRAITDLFYVLGRSISASRSLSDRVRELERAVWDRDVRTRALSDEAERLRDALQEEVHASNRAKEALRAEVADCKALLEVETAAAVDLRRLLESEKQHNGMLEGDLGRMQEALDQANKGLEKATCQEEERQRQISELHLKIGVLESKPTAQKSSTVTAEAISSVNTGALKASVKAFLKKMAALTSSEPASLLPVKAYRTWRQRGLKEVLKRAVAIYATRRTKVSTSQARPSLKDNQMPTEIIAGRFATLSPLHVFRSPVLKPRVTVVTDSINKGSLFGGVATSIIFAALLAKRLGFRLRVATRTESPDPGNVLKVLSHGGIVYDDNIDVAYCGGTSPNLDVADEDLFITTSWWTTASTIKGVSPSRIIYMVQEDERMFYPAGDDYRLCTDTLSRRDLRFVVNTQLLYEHLKANGLPNIADNGQWFEPAFHKDVFYPASKEREGRKRQLFVYARPNNPRNLFYLSLEVLEAAIVRGVLDPNHWDIHLVGKDIPKNVMLPLGCKPIVSENLDPARYAELVRGMDLGLSLMYTPHPSYPPLDLVASGAVVVTNTYGIKQSLASYSGNLLTAEPTVSALVTALGSALTLVDRPERAHNFASMTLNRSWENALHDVIASFAARR